MPLISAHRGSRRFSRKKPTPASGTRPAPNDPAQEKGRRDFADIHPLSAGCFTGTELETMLFSGMFSRRAMVRSTGAGCVLIQECLVPGSSIQIGRNTKQPKVLGDLNHFE
jgi:hypothetical protein